VPARNLQVSTSMDNHDTNGFAHSALEKVRPTPEPDKEIMQAQLSFARPSVCVCSLHPLAVEMLRDAIRAAGAFDFRIRTSTTFQQLQPREQGELLFLDGCCDNDWFKPALRWHKARGRVLVLISANAAHPGKQLRTLFLGVKGVIVASPNWRNEVGQAIHAVLEDRLWIGRDVLNEYVRRITLNLKKTSGNLDPLSHLTAREEQIMSLLLSGDSNKEIGNALGIAERTVKYHVSNILNKSQVSSRKKLLEKMTKDEEFKGLGTLQRPKCLPIETQAEVEI
jgi:DNA-binding NarL/FixJ family response regulator